MHTMRYIESATLIVRTRTAYGTQRLDSTLDKIEIFSLQSVFTTDHFGGRNLLHPPEEFGPCWPEVIKYSDWLYLARIPRGSSWCLCSDMRYLADIEKTHWGHHVNLFLGFVTLVMQLWHGSKLSRLQFWQIFTWESFMTLGTWWFCLMDFSNLFVFQWIFHDFSFGDVFSLEFPSRSDAIHRLTIAVAHLTGQHQRYYGQKRLDLRQIPGLFQVTEIHRLPVFIMILHNQPFLFVDSILNFTARHVGGHKLSLWLSCYQIQDLQCQPILTIDDCFEVSYTPAFGTQDIYSFGVPSRSWAKSDTGKGT